MSALVLPATGENIIRAAACIARGGIVALPTETVYGLGADAFNARAVARVFEAKARPSFDPLIVHISSIDDVERAAAFVPPKARILMKALWPGPLSLILPKRPELPDLVTSGLSAVALRLPAHPVAREIIAASGTLVAAPSANPFGYISPTRACHVARMLGDKIDLIIDGGPCEVGLESTVVDMRGELPRIVRPGGVGRESIQALVGALAPVGPCSARRSGSADEALAEPAASPGMLASHYAPRTRLYLAPRDGLGAAIEAAGRAETAQNPLPRRAALLFDAKSLHELGDAARLFQETRLLSVSGDLVEAAANLFSVMHELDGLGLDQIWAQAVPEEGLGAAINDRLGRAAAR